MNELVFENALKGSRAYAQLQSDLKSGLSHAYIIASGDDDVTDELFTLIAAAIFCNSTNIAPQNEISHGPDIGVGGTDNHPDSHSACLKCAECRKVLHGNHPDVFHINENRDKIKVEDVTGMLSTIYIRSLTGRKLYFIHRADLMNVQAQNKLLKTLEEPPANVTVFLGVANEAAMLDTIKSRARTVHIDVFDKETVYSAMLALGANAEMSAVAAACSEGMLGKARRITTSPEYAALYRSALDLMSGLNRSPDVVRFDSAIADGENIAAFLDVLSIVIRDIMLVGKQPDMVLSRHVLPEISALAEKYSPLALAKILSSINDTRRQLSLNVSALSAVDSLLFAILEVRHKYPKS